MLGFFKKAAGNPDRHPADAVERHSRGWGEMNKFLHTREGLRVLDFGATSPPNINYLTELGHSVYMANPVSDAAAPEWRKPVSGTAGDQPAEMEFDAERFCASNLTFSNRVFDVVLLWDTANYLPAALVGPFFQRMQEVLQPGGRLLAFFHPRKDAPEAIFSRYQLRDSEELLALRTGPFPIEAVYQTRQVERFFDKYEDIRFFLGKDNVREVYATR